MPLQLLKHMLFPRLIPCEDSAACVEKMCRPHSRTQQTPAQHLILSVYSYSLCLKPCVNLPVHQIRRMMLRLNACHSHHKAKSTTVDCPPLAQISCSVFACHAGLQAASGRACMSFTTWTIRATVAVGKSDWFSTYMCNAGMIAT